MIFVYIRYRIITSISENNYIYQFLWICFSCNLMMHHAYFVEYFGHLKITPLLCYKTRILYLPWDFDDRLGPNMVQLPSEFLLLCSATLWNQIFFDIYVSRLSDGNDWQCVRVLIRNLSALSLIYRYSYSLVSRPCKSILGFPTHFILSMKYILSGWTRMNRFYLPAMYQWISGLPIIWVAGISC